MSTERLEIRTAAAVAHRRDGRGAAAAHDGRPSGARDGCTRVSLTRPAAGAMPEPAPAAIGAGPAPGVTIGEEPFDGPDGHRVRAEVTAELRRRYGSDDRREGDPGAAAWAGDVAGFLIARSAEGEPVGCAALRRLEGDVFELKRMYVRPAARGRRIADALLAAAERLAVERGARRIILQTGTEQPEAMTVYRRNGYEPIAPFGEYADSPRSRCFGRDVR